MRRRTPGTAAGERDPAPPRRLTRVCPEQWRRRGGGAPHAGGLDGAAGSVWGRPAERFREDRRPGPRAARPGRTRHPG
ncbi:Flagellar hook-length control protein fliK [Streptomyces misionensis JCM 4497]